MNADLLCEELEITKSKLTELIKKGLPWTGSARSKQFDQEEVIRWLVENNLVEYRDPNVFKTQREAAAALGVTPEAMRKWSKEPGFPGSSGYYDIAEIQEWRDSRNKPNTGSKGHDSRADEELSIQDQLRKLKLDQAKEELISVEEVEREFERQYSYAKTELENLVAKIESQLPSTLDKEVVKMIRDKTEQTVRDCILIIQDIMRNPAAREDEGDDE